MLVQNEDDSFTSFHGEVPSPIQVLDASSSECLLRAYLDRATVSQAAETYNAVFRASAQDGASSNKKYEREGGATHWHGIVRTSWDCSQELVTQVCTSI